MSRAPLAFALLALSLWIPQVAEARVRLPTAPELLGKSAVILVGEVESVGEKHFSVKVIEQIAGPKKKLVGSIRVLRRLPSRRLDAMVDPAGITAGTRWVWVLEPSEQVYSSWATAPLKLTREAGEKTERVSCSVLRVKLQGGVKGELKAQTLAEFAAMVRAYRRCYRVERHNKATQIGSAEEIAAFKASSPHADLLVGRTPTSK